MDPKDLLQVNATVIAGLLILLTVQTFSGEIKPLEASNEWQENILQLEVEQWALNKTLTDLFNKASTAPTQERADELQIYVDEISTKLVEVTHKLEKMRNTQFKIID